MSLRSRSFTSMLDAELLADVDARLATEDAKLEHSYPGTDLSRQPVHTVYIPASHVAADTCTVWGREGLSAWHAHGGSAALVTELTGASPDVAAEVDVRVRAKLAREPIEDLRIDLEDGFGSPPDVVEDAAAFAGAQALATAVAAGHAPGTAGVRCKSLWPVTRARGLRSLEQFVSVLSDREHLPERFVVTLPKVTAVAHVEAMVLILERLEVTYGLPYGRLLLEVQVETPQAIMGSDGAATVAPIVHAAGRRLLGLHYGTYDYSAALDVAASQQRSDHPVADHAKTVMQVAAAGTGVRVVDGSSNVLPVGSPERVLAAWHLHASLVTRALERGFYQGWDLHPAQLPTRYAATYAFFRAGLPAAAARLRAFVDRVSNGVLDEPATMAMLGAFVIRGLDCGAIDEHEATDACGLDRAGLLALTRRPTT